MSVIQFLINNGYSIPRFCYHGLLSIAGNCRVCVIDDREAKTSVSCALCYEIYTSELFNDSAIIGVYVKNALAVREYIFEFLLLSHPLDCPICDRGGECELQDMSNSFGFDIGRNKIKKSTLKDKYFNLSISTHMTRCITCGRCVRFLKEITNTFTLGIVGRGNVCEISNYIINVDYNVYSSNIIDLCPVNIYRENIDSKNKGFLDVGVLCFDSEYEDNLINDSIKYDYTHDGTLGNINSIYCNNIRYEMEIKDFYDFILVIYDYKYLYCSKYDLKEENLLNYYISYTILFFISVNIHRLIFNYLTILNINKYILRLYYSLPITYSSRYFVDNVYECVLCANCSASCPSIWWNSMNYLGPAILLQAYRWVVNSNDSDISNRLSNLNFGYSISLCHGIGNCTIVCPKNLDPASKITDLKALIGFKLGNFYYS